MAGFVLFDTQMIMEKRRAGSTDCIKHSMDLFFDLISMFRRLLIILTQKVLFKFILNENHILFNGKKRLMLMNDFLFFCIFRRNVNNVDVRTNK